MAGVGPIGSYINNLMNQPIVARKRKAGAAEEPTQRPAKSTTHREERSSKGNRGESSRSRSHSHHRKESSSRPKSQAPVLPPPQSSSHPVDPQRDPPTLVAASHEQSQQETQEKTHYDVASQCYKEVITKSLDAYVDRDLSETLGDVQEYLGKLVGASARLSAVVARKGKMNVDDFEESLKNSDFNVASREAEVSKLLKEKEVLQKRYDSKILNLTADLQIRDNAVENLKLEMERKDQHLAAMDEKYQNTMTELRKKLEILQKSKEDALSLSRRNEEKLKKDLAKSEENFKILKNFCDVQVPQLRKAGYRTALTIMVKKLLFKYPNADMEYFSDLTNVPDMDIETEFDFDVEVDAAAEEVAGNAPAQGNTADRTAARDVQDDAISAVGGEK